MPEEAQVELEVPPPQKRKAGRPSRYCKEIADKICEEISKGASKKSAAAMHNIPYRTMIDWEKRYPSFSQALKLAWDAQEGKICQNILQWCASDWRSGAWYLERTRQERYAIRKNEITPEVLLEYLRKRKEEEEETKALARPVDK